MKLFFYLTSIAASIITLYIGLSKDLVWYTFFAVSPYLFILYILFIAKHYTATMTANVMTLFIISVGLYFLLDTTYMEKHLEYKFSFFFIPLWQWTMLLVSSLVVYFSNEQDV